MLAHSGPAWEELVGGFRPDGTKFVRFLCHRIATVLTSEGWQSGVIEQGTSLLQLQNTVQYNKQMLIHAAHESEANDRIPEAIKLYNLARDYATVIACLAQALGSTPSLPTTGGEKQEGESDQKDGR